jgi:hypothetical protein
LSGGISYFNGGFLQNSRYINRTSYGSGAPVFLVDSSLSNIGRKAPRKYRGADVQLTWNHGKSETAFRAEYWRGTQTAVAEDSETPGSLPDEPYYVRKFDGAFIYLLHRLTKHHQLAVKYDWYDPNTQVKSKAIRSESRFTSSDIRYNTLGFGYINYFNENLKLVLWYDLVRNENSSLQEFTNDIKDDVFTCRLQFRF